MSRVPSRSSVNSIQRFTTWFEEAYETHFERLYRYAFSITKQQQLAEDVVAEVFANIWSKKPDHTNIKELSAYLHVSVKHSAIRLVSRDRQRFTYQTYDESLQVSDLVNPENLLLGKELEELMARVVDGLPPHSKLVYELSRGWGYSHQQIADELGISPRTVESHLRGVLKKMREMLHAHLEESDIPYQFLSRLAIGITLLSNAIVDLFG